MNPLRRLLTAPLASLGGGILLTVLFIACTPAARPIATFDLDPDHHRQASVHLRAIERCNEQGKYAQAIVAANRLLALVENQKGSHTRGVAVCLNILGGLYNSFGEYDLAEAKLTRALQITQGLPIVDDALTASCLGLLARVHMNKGHYRRAKPLAHRVLSIREAATPGLAFMVSTSLNTLGEIYLQLNDFEQAEAHLLRAIEIRKQQRNTHGLVVSLNHLGRLYYRSGDYPSAASVAQTTLDLGQMALGEYHPHVAETLNLLGRITASQGRYQVALSHLARARRITDETIDQMKGFTSSSQKLHFIRTSRDDLNVLLSLIAGPAKHSPSAVREGLQTAFRRKGVVLEMQKQFQRALLAGDDRTAAAFNRLSEVRGHLTHLTFSDPGSTGLQRYVRTIARLTAEKERLEVELSSRSRAYMKYVQTKAATCETVAEGLEKRGDGTLVELLRFRRYDFENPGADPWREARYVAFVLVPGDPYSLHLVDLGSAGPVEELVSSFKDSVTCLRECPYSQVTRLAGQLYRLVFQPIEHLMDRRKAIYLSLAGSLNLIPFEVFRQPTGRFLIEEYTFNYLSSGRDLLGHDNAESKPGKYLLLGDPDFDRAFSSFTDRSLQRYPYDQKQPTVEQQPVARPKLRFQRLPKTREEVVTIRSLLGARDARLYTGSAASESVLFEHKSPRILHLATHGFFLSAADFGFPDHSSLSLPGDRGHARTNLPVLAQPERLTLNPYMQSGLALAGANQAAESPSADHLPGIVTASKILNLQLQGTEMVVLSACNTGLGEVARGEGVFGLRRAFEQAGARSLVMSMWKVPDRETKELMIRFYQNIQDLQMNRCQALRHAILDQITIVKRRYGIAHPFFWGAFVFLGQP